MSSQAGSEKGCSRLGKPTRIDEAEQGPSQLHSYQHIVGLYKKYRSYHFQSVQGV